MEENRNEIQENKLEKTLKETETANSKKEKNYKNCRNMWEDRRRQTVKTIYEE